ncbi:MAG: flagellar assembly peptidoglycan hydrolase FlgJ [Pseudomonadota bacterium]
MAIASLDNSFYADPANLTALKREASAQTPDALRETARQFESLFTNMMLKSMRDASGASGGDDLFGSDQQNFYQDMFDQQLSTQLSKGKGLGLADMLVRQLMQGAGADNTPEASPVSAVQDPSVKGDLTTSMTWPPRTRDEFVQAVLPAATAAGRELGVDPATIVAHAALETGWGKSVPVGADGVPSFNLFGIKAGASWKGETVNSVTNEFAGGHMQSVKADFRSYASPEHSLGDYVKLLKSSPRYAQALGTGSDAAAYAKALQQGGYATDPDYATKLTAVAARLKSHLTLPISVTGAHSA